MRILLIDQFGDLGGAQRCLLEAAAGFQARGWEVHAAIPNPGPLAEALRPLARATHFIPCGPFTPARKNASDGLRFAAQIPRQAIALRGIADRARIDMLYVNGPRLLPAAALARGSRALIFHAHSIVSQPAARRLAAWALRAGQAGVLASSQFVARSIGPDARGRVQVIYNGVQGFGCAPRPRLRHTHIVALGRIAPEKGQLEFVRAARLASRDRPDLRFTVCGAPMFSRAGYLEAVQAEAWDLVRLAGWTDDAGAFLSQADVLVVPSAPIDTNPRVIPEAFAAGVPVVAFASGGIPELIEHGVSGILVAPRTPERLAESILAAVREPAALNAMAERAYARWQRLYTLGRFQSEVCEAVETALRRHRQRTQLRSAGAKARA